jgi:hypothetical protein
MKPSIEILIRKERPLRKGSVSMLKKLVELLSLRKKKETNFLFPVIMEMDKILPEYRVYGYSIADQIIEQYGNKKGDVLGYLMIDGSLSTEPSHKIHGLSKSPNRTLFVRLSFCDNSVGKQAQSNIYQLKAVIDGEYEAKKNELTLRTINLEVR